MSVDPHAPTLPTTTNHEVLHKEARVRALMASGEMDALLLRRVASFAWATAGVPSYVSTAVENGEASLLYLPSRRCVITNVIEAPRLERELGLGEQGWEMVASPWHEPNDAVARLTAGLRLGADGPLPGAQDVSASVSRLRAQLGPAEVERFRAIGRDSAEAMAAAAGRVQPGQTEHEIAASIAGELLSRALSPIVLQVASDDRVLAYRHLLPTDRRLERYAFLSFCSRRAGLVCSITRTLHFGRVPESLSRKQRAAAAVDATLIAGTRPGARVRELFDRAARRYADEGFDGEWRMHHQGGAAGYEPREYVATPTCDEVVAAGQVFAWNPTVQGAKCEDTIAVGARDNEILTEMAGWPTLAVEVDGRTWQRPAIREIT